MSQASQPIFLQMLKALSANLDKAAAHATAKKIDPSVFVNARLAPDMFPLSRQVQIATDHAKGATARLSGRENPKYEDTESTIDELKARIAKTLDFVSSVPASEIDGSEEKDITLTIGGQPRTLKGQRYLLHNALPNFFFHVTTAYDILRHNGVEVGKRDYMGLY
ncbi:MAG: DUF1993 domain-containing protein [Propylenella sp.]